MIIPKYIVLFAGCGGLSEGFTKTKLFNGIAHVFCLWNRDGHTLFFQKEPRTGTTPLSSLKHSTTHLSSELQ